MKFSLAALFTIFFYSTAYAKDVLELNIAVVGVDEPAHIPLSLTDPIIENPAIAGIDMSLLENNRTGKFLGKKFASQTFSVSEDNSIDSLASDLIKQQFRLVIADLPEDKLLALSEKIGNQALIFNIRSEANALRNEQCQRNILHIAPSRAMKTDALAQYLLWKRWDKWLVLAGKYEADQAYLSSLRYSAKKFNAKIIETKAWTFDAGSRRTDSGHIIAQQEVPIASRGKAHDVLVVVDEADEFGEYIPYMTESPRPVVGTHGLFATNWHRSHEQWGATQLQRRFIKFAKRNMQPRDYAGWLAVNAIAEATTVNKTNDHQKIRETLLSQDFKLAAFKGSPLTFRTWNGQLRQPMLIATAKMLVTVSPQDKFLHQLTNLDTLGLDQPESTCEAFK